MTESQPRGDVCPNCSAPATGPYCAQCGQRQGAVRVSLRRILADALEDQFSVNAALPRTLKSLLIHPGALTREYFNHRIARYIAPVRLYLISSVIFFLLLSLITGPKLHVTASTDVASDSVSATDSVAATGDSSMVAERAAAPVKSDADPDPDVAPDSAGRARPNFGVQISGGENISVNLGNERLNHYFEQRIRTLTAMPREQMIREIADGFLEQAPKAVFIMLPMFALLLKVLYFRRYYVEHFIFALHLHAFTFVIFTILLILPDQVPMTWLLVAWIPVYTLIAMKRVYGQGMFRTLVKWWTLGVTYTVLLAFASVGALLAALATM